MLVVFDLDGTLVDSKDDIQESLRRALRAVPAGRESDAADEEALQQRYHGVSLERFFASARPGGGKEALAAFTAAYREHYYTHLLDRTRPFPGVVEGLERLLARRAAGTLRLAVATTKMTATARRVTDGLGLGRFLDLVAGSDGLPCKPDPAVLFAVFRHFRDWGYDEKEPRDRGLMVGDTDHDIHAGRSAGLRTCVVGWSGVSLERLREARPDHHAETFADVVDLILG